MDELNRILEKFTDPSSGSLHGAAFIAVDKSGTIPIKQSITVLTKNAGKIIYNHVSGKLDLDPQSPRRMELDSLCWIASMTKLMTSVAVMQLVERGLVGLDDDVRDLVPELKNIRILQGFEDCNTEAEGSKRPVYSSLDRALTLR